MKELRSKLEVDKSLSEQLFSKSWVVYAKKPFGNVHSVTEYLGRYTHKIAISNNRLLSIDKENANECPTLDSSQSDTCNRFRDFLLHCI